VTEKAGLADAGPALSATFADFDNSNKISLFLSGLDGVKVYQYTGDGGFQNITGRTGLQPVIGELATSAVLFDADDDGFLDLVVTAYTNLNSPPQKAKFRFPDDFSGAATHFYRNNGDGTFTDITASAGLASARGRMRARCLPISRITATTADFFDQVKLVAVDHRADEEIYANEIFASNPVPPQLYAVHGKHFPLSAVDDRGDDVLPLLLEPDGRYPTAFKRHRILGMADTHSLTLDLGELPAGKTVTLWLNGWVFWTDSNAAQALRFNRRLRMESPHLQVRDAAGKWVTVISDMGLPSGTHRTMRVDLTGKFLSADHHVRIVSNLCVYWDQVFFTTDEAPAPAPFELPMLSADLHYRGFSTPASDPAHVQPDSFDYQRVMATAPWNPQRGNYTRYGGVRELVARADDQFVVMATGDELSVQFSAAGLPPLKPGWKRDYFLRLRGYAKDGEPNTAFAWTVAPLPFGAMSSYPPGPHDSAPSTLAYHRYLQEYQTCPGHALIPPLAPAVR
jgi:hypothetical protein